ncbi:MAG: tol-pal system YbgF family protein [Cyclobacteriaceae bacterium]
MNNHIAFDEYLSGKMPANQKLDLEKQLEKDAELVKAFEAYKILIDGIRYTGRSTLKNHFHEIETSYDTNNSAGRSFLIGRIKPWQYAAASIVLFVVALVLLFTVRTDNASQLAVNYYEPYPLTEAITQRSGDVQHGVLEEALAAYDQGNNEKASNMLQQILIESAGEMEKVNFYLASAYQADGEFEKAIPLYEKIYAEGNTFKTQAGWYASLAYLQLNKPVMALNILKELEQGEHAYASRAKELLQEIKSK